MELSDIRVAVGGEWSRLERLQPDSPARRWLRAHPPPPILEDRHAPCPAWDLPSWLAHIGVDRGAPPTPSRLLAAQLASLAEDPIALHFIGVLVPDAASGVLAALGAADPLDRQTRLLVALADTSHGEGVSAIAEPLMEVARCMAIGGLLWPTGWRAGIDDAIRRVQGAIPIDDRVMEWLAGAPASKRRRLVLQGHLAARLEALEARLEAALAPLVEALPHTVDLFRARWRAISTRALVWQFTGPEISAGPAAIDVDLAAARRWLLDRPGWPDAVDRQRWGVESVPGDLLGDWFPHGLIELALWRMTPERGARERAIGELLMGLPADGPRYYRSWQHIPVDADCLGLALRLASLVRDEIHHRVGEWLGLLTGHVSADGRIPTWLYSDAMAERVLPWPGDLCLASRLSLAEGLAAWDHAGHRTIVEHQLGEALGRVDGDRVRGAHYYPDVWTTAQVLRIAGHDDPRLAPLVAHCRLAQGPDGGFGSPVATALIGGALADRGALGASAIRRAARYLGEHQAGDGRWFAERIYDTPAKPGLMRPLQSDSLSTALCGAALAIFADALGQAAG